MVILQVSMTCGGCIVSLKFCMTQPPMLQCEEYANIYTICEVTVIKTVVCRLRHRKQIIKHRGKWFTIAYNDVPNQLRTIYKCTRFKKKTEIFPYQLRKETAHKPINICRKYTLNCSTSNMLMESRLQWLLDTY